MSSKRVLSLDALRGIAALAVVFYHYIFKYDEIYGHDAIFNIFGVFEYGQLGVQLFFMISGFVIYLSLENTKNIKTFIVNRVSRIYPAYWLAVCLTFILVATLGLPGREVDFSSMLINLSMLQGYLGVRHVDGVYWTLMVEIQFYIIISVLYFYLPKRFLLIGFLFLIVINLIVGYCYHVDNKYFLIKVMNLIFSSSYLHYFGAGIGFYLLSKNESLPCAWLLIVLSILHNILFISGVELFIIVSFYAVFFIMIYKKDGFLNNKILCYFGFISYSLYLVHQNIGYIIFNYFYTFNINPFVALIVALLVSISIAHFSSKYIEKVIGRKFKKRLSIYVN